MSTLKDPSTRAAFRATVAAVARRELGVKESPPRSNKVKYAAWYGMNGYPWCAQFVSWVFAQAAQIVGCENPLAGMHGKKGFSSTVFGFAVAKKKGLVLGPDEALLPGDVIVWKHTAVTGHTGVLVEVSADGKRFLVWEGNTSPTDHSSRNGGEVAAHWHTRTDGKHDTLLGFIRPTRSVTNPKKK